LELDLGSDLESFSLLFLRGMIPLLETWLGNKVSLEYEERADKRVSSIVMKQWVESQHDLEIQYPVVHDILDFMPEEIRQKKDSQVSSCK
jgi:pre-mRNA-processing factor 8